MAVNVGTAVGYLDLDTTKFTSGISGALKSLKGFFSQEASFSSRLKSMGNTMTSVGSTMTKTITVAVAGFGAAVVKAGSNFESAMSQVAATKGTTVDAIQEIKDKAIEMGSTTSFSATEAAEGLNILAMAGLDTEDSLKVIPDVLNLAAAGCISMESAASYVTGAIKGFNSSMDDSQYFADLMAKGASLANTDVNMLGEALSNASSNALSYGQNAEDTTVALLRLAEQNVTGSEAANALSRAMADLYTPTSSASKALEKLGVSAYDESGAAREVNDVIDELNASLQGMTDEQANAYKNTIFSTFGLKAFNKMTVSSAEKVQSFRDELASASDTVSGMGSAYDMSQTQLDNLQGSVTLFKSALEGLEIRLYNLKNEGLKSIVDFATGVLDRLNSLNEGTLELIEKIALVAAAIGPALILGGKIVSTIGSITESFGAVKTAMAGFEGFGTLFSSMSGGLGTIITTFGGLVAIIGTVIAVVAGFKAAWDDDFDEIQESTQSIFESIQTIIQGFQGVVQGIISSIKEAWDSDWGGIRTSVETVISALVSIISSLLQIAIGVASAIKEAWDSDFGGIQSLVSGVFNGVMDIFSGLLEFISGIVKAISQLLQGDFAGAWESVKSAVTGLVEHVVSGLGTLLSSVGTFFKNLINNIGSWLKSLVSIAKEKMSQFASNIKEGAKNAVEKFGEFIKNLPSNLGKWLGNAIGKALAFEVELTEKAKSAGKNFLDKLISFIKQLPGNIWNWLKNVISKVTTFAQEFPAKAKEAGKNFLDYLINNVKQAPAKMKAGATAIVNAVKDLPSKFTEVAHNMITGLVNGIQEKMSSAISAVKDFASGFVDGFKDALGIHSPSKVMKEQVGEQIANGVIAGIDAKKEAGKIKAKEYAETLISAAEKKLDKLETYNKISVEQEVSYWKTILKQLKKGSSDYLTVYKKYIAAKEKASETALSSAETALNNYKVYYNMSLYDEMNYWNAIRKQFKKGTDERIEADQKYYAAKEAYYDAVNELDEEYKENQKALKDELKENIADLTKEYEDAITSRTSAIMSSFKLFDSYTQKDEVTADTLISNLQSQQDAMELYTSNLNTLMSRDIPDDMLESIKDMGVDATQEIVAMNSMTDEQLQQYIQMWNNLNKEAEKQATIDLSGMKEETTKQINELKKETDIKLSELKDTYESDLKDLKTTTQVSSEKVGKTIISSMVDAISSSKLSLTKSVSSLSKSLKKQLNQMATDVSGIIKKIDNSISKASSKVATVKKASGSHKTGLDYVPYDGYIAQLHKGEAVLTEEENKNRNSSNDGSQNFYFYGTPPLDERETARQMKLAQQQMALGF